MEGSFGCYLFVKPDYNNWRIWSDLKGEKRFIRSGSAGLRCPARPESKFSKRSNTNDWSFNKAGENNKEDWEEREELFSSAPSMIKPLLITEDDNQILDSLNYAIQTNGLVFICCKIPPGKL